MRYSIIVGVDYSPEATDAARVGASLARRLDRSLVLAHVVDDPRAIHGATRQLTGFAAEIGAPEARKRVAVVHGTDDHPEAGLAGLVREEDADLLVVGSRGRGPFGASAPSSLLRASPCPVVVVPVGAANRFAGSRSAPGPVVCGIDWSVESGAALVVAEGLASQLGCEVAPIYVDQIGPWTKTLRGVQVEVGDPPEVLARAAQREGASLIVVAMRGRETLAPSVSRTLAGIAPVPVLIVPPNSRLPRFAITAEIERPGSPEFVQAA